MISLGYKDIKDLKIGKEIVFKISAESQAKAKSQVKKMCEQLLANPVIEDYKIEID